MNMQAIHTLSLGLALALVACSQPSTDDAKSGKGDKAGKGGKGDKPETAEPSKTPSEPPIAEPPAVAAPIPFSVQLRAAKIEGFPGIHSEAGAMHEGLLVLMAGRRNGMHVFPPERAATQVQAFPRTEANESIYVIDPAKSVLVGSANIDKLPESYQEQLRATNTQYTEDGGWLYIVGGYTYDGESMKTLDRVTAIDLAALIEAVKAGQPLDEAFATAHMVQASNLALAVTGGELQKLGDQFLLIFGNRFDGLYTPGESVAVQTYSESVRAFGFGLDVSSGAPKLAVTFAGSDPAVGTQQDPEGPYHRRDGVIEPAIDTQGKPRIAVYGGAFKGGRMEGYTTPIYIDADSAAPLGFSITEDKATTQLLSQYKCGVIQTYDGAAAVMYTTLFGGISQYYWDPASGSLKRDPIDLANGVDGLPFIDSVSTMRLSNSSAAGTTGGGTQTAQFLHEGQSFPPADARPQCGGDTKVDATLLGTETVFFDAPGVPAYDNGVLRLDQITAPTVVGYLVGGIAATAPYSVKGPTCASDIIYTVTLDPTLPSKTIELHAPAPKEAP
jgi:hypothetical protein